MSNIEENEIGGQDNDIVRKGNEDVNDSKENSKENNEKNLHFKILKENSEVGDANLKTLRCKINYIKDDGRSRPFLYCRPLKPSDPHNKRSDLVSVTHIFPINDARLGVRGGLNSQYSCKYSNANQASSSQTQMLDEHGFQLFNFPAAEKFQYEDYYEPDGSIIQQRYYPEVAAFVKEITNAAFVLPYHHRVRNGSLSNPLSNNFSQNSNHCVAGYAGGAHVDSTHKSADKFVSLLVRNHPHLRNFAKGRFIALNVWRSITPDKTIQNNHLCFLDAQTVSFPEDYVTIEAYLPDAHTLQYRMDGEQRGLVDRHKWWYFPDMRYDEVVVFKTHDSDLTKPARHCFHSSIIEEDKVAGQRESIEVRVIAFLPDHLPNTFPPLLDGSPNDVQVNEVLERNLSPSNCNQSSEEQATHILQHSRAQVLELASSMQSKLWVIQIVSRKTNEAIKEVVRNIVSCVVVSLVNTRVLTKLPSKEVEDILVEELMEEGNVVELLEENVSNGGKEGIEGNKMKLMAKKVLRSKNEECSANNPLSLEV